MPPRLTAPALLALDLIARSTIRRMPVAEFELRMHQRGCKTPAMQQAMATLERRGWATRQSGMLEITDAGHAAALQGEPPRTRPARPTGRRLPNGFFG